MEILAIAVIGVSAIVLQVAVRSALRRLSIQPDDEEARSRGFRDVVERVRSGARRRN